MAMKERVLGVLRGPEAFRIRFTVPSTSGMITINPATFTTVASAIDAGKVRVTLQATFDDGAGAQFDTDASPGAPSGELLVPPILGRIQEGEVMHECTHAFFDLTKSGIKATEEEAVCYVVNALYFRMTGLTPALWTGGEPHKSAKSVADALLRQYAVGVAGIPAVNITAWHNLVLAVALDPFYFLKTAGLVRWFWGPTSYAHDG